MKPLFTGILFFLLGVSSVSAFEGTPDAARAQVLYEQALALREQTDWQGAEQSLRKAVQMDPTRFEFHQELSNLYIQRHDELKDQGAPQHDLDRLLGAGVYELERAVVLNPQLIPAQYNLGILYKNLGKSEQAREQFRKVLQLNPQMAPAWMQIGAIYEDQGFFEDAREAYERAAELDPGNPEIQETLTQLSYHEQEDQSQRTQEDRMSALSRLGGMGSLLSNRNAAYQNTQTADPWGGEQSYGQNYNQYGQTNSDPNAKPNMTALGLTLLQSLMNKKNNQ